jgi:hypothetical protein
VNVAGWISGEPLGGVGPPGWICGDPVGGVYPPGCTWAGPSEVGCGNPPGCAPPGGAYVVGGWPGESAVPTAGGATGPAGGNGPSRGGSSASVVGVPGAVSAGRLTGVPYTEPPDRFGGGGGGTDARARTGVAGSDWLAGGPDGAAASPGSWLSAVMRASSQSGFNLPGRCS